MKTHLLVFALHVSFFAVFSQNWQPLRLDEVYHFSLETQPDSLATSIYADSIVVAGGDSIAFFQENFAYQQSAWGDKTFIRHQPHFVGKQMIKRSDSSFLFKDDTLTLVLYPLAALGQSWVCDSTANVVATVIQADTMHFFGIQDSVKTFSFSNGKVLQLSKSFGLIKCTDFYSGDTYVLVGLQQAALGLHPLTLQEIFDFEVGDVFMYEYRSWTSFPEQMFPNICTKQKRTVLEKTLYPDSVKYVFEIKNKRFTTTMFGNACYLLNNSFIYYTDTVEQVIVFASNSLENAHRGVIKGEYINRSYLPVYVNTIPPDTTFLWYEQDMNQIPSKKISIPSWNWLSGSDTIANLLGIHTIWKKGLGVTFEEGRFHESGGKWELLGYIKNGIQVGDLYPDWYFTAITPPSTSALQIYPNPSEEEELNIESSESGYYKVQNAIGQEILPATYLISDRLLTLSVADWQSGIYWIEFVTDKGSRYTQMYVKR